MLHTVWEVAAKSKCEESRNLGKTLTADCARLVERWDVLAVQDPATHMYCMHVTSSKEHDMLWICTLDA